MSTSGEQTASDHHEEKAQTSHEKAESSHEATTHVDKMTTPCDKARRTVIVGMDNNQSSDFALDWYKKNVHHPSDYVIIVNCPNMKELLHSSWSGTTHVDHDTMVKLLTEEQGKIQSNLKIYEDKMKAAGLQGMVRVVAHSNAGAAICQVSDETGASMIVVGCRGHGALHRLRGSVSDYVCHHAHIPVFLCRQGAHHHAHDKHHHHHHFSLFHHHKESEAAHETAK